MSKCVRGRKRHRFRSPQTRSLTDDLKCWYCGKSVRFVKLEQKMARRKKKSVSPKERNEQ